MGYCRGSGPEQGAGSVALPADTEEPEFTRSAAQLRGADGEEGGGSRHFRGGRRRAVHPQHRGSDRHRRVRSLCSQKGPNPQIQFV